MTPVVQGCLLLNRGSQCRLGHNVLFFVILLGALGLKIIFLVLALIFVKQRPLLTVDDAVTSYLDKEDRHTKGSSLEWTLAGKWECKGPLETYPALSPREQITLSQPISNGKVAKWLAKWKRQCLGLLQTFSRHWANAWPSNGDSRDAAVPKWDIISYSNTMKSKEILYWVGFYLATISVAIGVFIYIAVQNGWIVQPTTKG